MREDLYSGRMQRRNVVGRLSKVVVFVVVLVVAAAGVALAANRIGDNNANTLNGTEDADAIYGLGGGDTLNGRAGNDEVSGNNGGDTMNGGANDDVMVGGRGPDTINTGNSTNVDFHLEDFVYAVDGFSDTVCVGTGDWEVRYDDGLDTILGPPGCTTVIAEPSSTTTATEAASGGAVSISSADTPTAAP
jgi:Ca2+-binding RTX toxin-like protein